MTEQHEIFSIIDNLADIANEINYEINTTPGSGKNFVNKLAIAKEHIALTILSLNSALLELEE